MSIRVCFDGKVTFQHTCSMEKYELDELKMGEAERTLFISKKPESFPLHNGCNKKVVKQCNLHNLLMNERSDFGPVEVDAYSQKKNLVQGKGEKQFQNLEGHHYTEAITLEASSPKHEKGDKLEAGQEVTLKIPSDTMHALTMMQENVDSDRTQKSEKIPKVGGGLVDNQRTSLLNTPNKGILEDHRPNDSAFPMKTVTSDNISIGAFQGPDSVSCRSTTTSSTSARSFAFPVLSGEWNGSPVRMAGNNRGHMKRKKWWKTCFG